MLSSTLYSALNQMGWLRTSTRSDALVLPSDAACLLRWILESNRRGSSFVLDGNRYQLSSGGVRRLQGFVSKGIQLTCQFRNWQAGIDTWLGSRLYLSHASNLNASSRYTSIVSSRVGRGQRHIPDWPQQVDSVLASCQKLKHHVLLVPGTATDAFVRTAVSSASVSWVEVDVPPAKTADSFGAVEWLLTVLDDSQIHEKSLRRISVSPALPQAPAAQTRSPDESSSLRNLPLQDRIAIGLADRVIGLSVRSKGTISSLLRTRATDPPFPAATTYIAMRSRNKPSNRRDESSALLSAGVVGWVVRDKAEMMKVAGLLPCGQQMVPVQLSSPIAGRLKELDETDWQFLSHCTRGSSGPRPLESADEHRRRTWIEGVKTPHPLLTLAEILQTGVIRCNDTLFRGAKPIVSFSAVPLQDLLRQRKFQPHLGRWDWEPYGLMIQTRALQIMGAKPVIYGDDEVFDSLSVEQQPFFQPKKRKSNSTDWESEREWRVPGDVRLGDLRKEDVLVFVATKLQANSLARVSRWPVVWTQG